MLLQKSLQVYLPIPKWKKNETVQTRADFSSRLQINCTTKFQFETQLHDIIFYLILSVCMILSTIFELRV